MRAFPAFALLTACSGSPEAVVDPETRRAEHRASLQAKLGENYDQPVPGVGPELESRGAAVWSKSCVGCHGVDGRGGDRGGMLEEPAANLVDGRGRDFYSEAGQYLVIAEGVPGTAMAPFGKRLSADDMKAVLAHLRKLRREADAAGD